MLELATAMTAFRTYPHVDMRETGVRAARILARRLVPAAADRAMHAERVPFLLPLNAQCTLMQPAKSVIGLIEQLESQHDLELNFSMGFSAADFAECGPVLFGYGIDPNLVRDKVQQLHTEVAVTRRGDWTLELLEPRAAVEKGIALALEAQAPVVIADTQDNPGAGGDSNTTGMLHALLKAEAGARLEGRVAIGLIFDPEAARTARAAGVGATLRMQIGRAVRTWSGELTDPPVTVDARVLAVSDGVVPMHGPMTAGATMQLGASACIDVQGIRVLLSSAKAQMLDLDLYRFLGVEPREMKLLVNKSSVHFRAAFGPIASSILVAKAPGPMAADPGDLPWTKLSATTAPRP
jgi:microcystin degradation protein MlrC